MQLRCTYCQTMFAIGRDEKLAALEHMDENNQKYYDAHCPKCRRANRVERFKLEFSYPGWREAIKAMAKEATKADAGQAPIEAETKPAIAPVKIPSPPKVPDRGKGKPAAKAKKISSPKGKKTTGTKRK
jgi:hypothetical protein